MKIVADDSMILIAVTDELYLDTYEAEDLRDGLQEAIDIAKGVTELSSLLERSNEIEEQVHEIVFQHIQDYKAYYGGDADKVTRIESLDSCSIVLQGKEPWSYGGTYTLTIQVSDINDPSRIKEEIAKRLDIELLEAKDLALRMKKIQLREVKKEIDALVDYEARHSKLKKLHTKKIKLEKELGDS